MATKRKAEIPPAPSLDCSAYDGHEAWTNKRFAWEFLRRNSQFKEACDALEDGTSERRRAAVARQFGLVRLKHYAEPYESADETIKPPVFRSRAVEFIGHRRRSADNPRPSIHALPGQFLVRFDLKFAIQDDQILRAQLKAAEEGLARRLNTLRRAAGETAKSGRNRPKARLLEQLKVLDVHAIQGITHNQRADLLFGKDSGEKRFIDKISAAKDMAENGYLLLGALGDTLPTSKE
ncbi:transcriptional regulator domain-containing protein [Ralstonia insidiosa]|uniref:transcriptional regulator domain-containing protein n=1 Tax=Ralstonia insidiosa TaxID=190721 RepID=UPI000CEDECA5|nr:DUF6499 domain-containing protein [Ralstonia insidiosa]